MNSYDDNKKWKIVHSNFTQIAKKEFTLRTVKDHIDHLIILFKKEELSNLRRFGTEEQYGEKEDFLQELLNLKDVQKIRRVSGEEIRSIKTVSISDLTSSDKVIFGEVDEDIDDVAESLLETFPTNLNLPVTPSTSKNCNVENKSKQIPKTKKLCKRPLCKCY